MKPVVYAIVVDGMPRYIGSGTEKRANSHISTAIGHAHLLATGAPAPKSMQSQAMYYPLIAALLVHDVEVNIIKRCKSYEEARKVEKETITKIGLNQLWNLRNAGTGLTSPKARRMNSNNRMREMNSTRGKQRWADPAFKARMKKIHEDRWKRIKNDPKALKEFSRKLSKAATAQWNRGDGWSQKI